MADYTFKNGGAFYSYREPYEIHGGERVNDDALLTYYTERPSYALSVIDHEIDKLKDLIDTNYALAKTAQSSAEKKRFLKKVQHYTTRIMEMTDVRNVKHFRDVYDRAPGNVEREEAPGTIPEEKKLRRIAKDEKEKRFARQFLKSQTTIPKYVTAAEARLMSKAKHGKAAEESAHTFAADLFK